MSFFNRFWPDLDTEDITLVSPSPPLSINIELMLYLSYSPILPMKHPLASWAGPILPDHLTESSDPNSYLTILIGNKLLLGRPWLRRIELDFWERSAYLANWLENGVLAGNRDRSEPANQLFTGINPDEPSWRPSSWWKPFNTRVSKILFKSNSKEWILFFERGICERKFRIEYN